MDKTQAIKASKHGATLAFISAGITLVVMLYAILSDAQDSVFAFWNDWLILIDVGLLAILGIGVLRHSRAAAVALLLYWIISKIEVTMEMGGVKGIGMSLVFLYYFGRAILGNFKYHQICKQEDTDYKPVAKWTYIASVPMFIALAVILIFQVLTLTGNVLPVEAIAGTDIRDSDRQLLLDKEIIVEEENIKYFYASGLSSVLESGSLLSDMGVTTYFTNQQGEIEIYWMAYDQIRSVEMLDPGSALDDSVFQVNGMEEDAWIRIELSTTESGDKKFLEELRMSLKGQGIVPE